MFGTSLPRRSDNPAQGVAEQQRTRVERDDLVSPLLSYSSVPLREISALKRTGVTASNSGEAAFLSVERKATDGQIHYKSKETDAFESSRRPMNFALRPINPLAGGCVISSYPDAHSSLSSYPALSRS